MLDKLENNTLIINMQTFNIERCRFGYPFETQEKTQIIFIGDEATNYVKAKIVLKRGMLPWMFIIV